MPKVTKTTVVNFSRKELEQMIVDQAAIEAGDIDAVGWESEVVWEMKNRGIEDSDLANVSVHLTPKVTETKKEKKEKERKVKKKKF